MDAFMHYWPAARGIHCQPVTDHRWIPLLKSQYCRALILMY